MLTINVVEIETDDYNSLEEMCDSVIGRLDFFKEKHPTFTFSIEKHYDTNKLIVKNCLMNEQVN